MGAVVWDTAQDSEPVFSAFNSHEKYTPKIESAPVSNHAHHHITHPNGVYHTLGNLAHGFTHKQIAIGGFAHWEPDSDVRETKIAYHIEIEAAGVSDKNTIKVSLLSPNVLQVEGVALRPDLLRGREGDGELMWNGEGAVKDKVDGEDTKQNGISGKDAPDGGPCTHCPDTENEMTTRIIRGERKIGAWHRNFTLPLDCDLTTTRAKLEAGLLHISVFKKVGSMGDNAKRIVVE